MHMETTTSQLSLIDKLGCQRLSPHCLKSHTNIFEEAHKLWHNYTRAFCFLALRNYNLEKYSLVHALLYYYFQAHLFVALRTKEVPPNYNTRLPVTVQIPTGVIRSFYHDIYYPVHSLITVYNWVGNFDEQTLVWVFTLHPKLALNFTIHDLHNSLRSPVDCDFGKLIISNFKCHVNNRTFCQQLENSSTLTNEQESMITDCKQNNFKALQNNQRKHVYCGHLSNFSILPIFSEIVVEVQNKQCMFYEMNAYFVVMDINTVVSLPNQNVTKQLRIVENIFFVRQRTQLATYFLQANKSCRIILNSSWEESKSIFYDGPDELANIILKKNSIHLTSTFQCSVQILSVEKYCQQITFSYEKLPKSFSLQLKQQQ